MKGLIIFIAANCLLTTSCQSGKVAYVDRPTVPSMAFPVFPSLERTVNPDGSWTIPKDSIDHLAEFYIKYRALEETYGHEKQILERED